ncbi:MAG: hypothetical protein COZ06_10690 [Armatimonadetes bacterium CG_4_10_14_3_um_filter_66_18]|nr:hypothetical protein [Armatimonadota bacterium]PIX49300.1 MAG: hypothetical protein COZ57_03775 [Armatimonadetes bacterium CG_4_8_14_3_um_filter_66_20]PIY50183.1 MAG: hypothetical protein COZ06_10690 [Armatimonadetes bacterium CG_4_10_14_3_um_filter_66_18]
MAFRKNGHKEWPRWLVVVPPPAWLMACCLTRWLDGRFAGDVWAPLVVLCVCGAAGTALLGLLGVCLLLREILRHQCGAAATWGATTCLAYAAFVTVLPWSFAAYCSGITHAVAAAGPARLVAEARAALPRPGEFFSGVVPKSQWGPAFRALNPRWVEVRREAVTIVRGGWGGTRVGVAVFLLADPPNPPGFRIAERVYYWGE